LLAGATTVFAELKDGLDEIWHEDKKPGSGLWSLLRNRVLSFGMVLALSFLLMVSLLVSTALDAVGNMWMEWWPHALLVVKPLSSVFSFLVISTLFASIFKLLPQATIQWKDVALGSISTAVLFYVGKFAIGVYLGNSHLVSSYGGAGSVVALILWVYYSAQIFFLGAEFTHQHVLMFGSLRKPGQR
jgi:membrane protein